MRETTAEEILPFRHVSVLNDNMVVTLDRYGKPLSRFKDNIWDFSATSMTRKKINFEAMIKKVDHAIIIEGKKLDIAVRFLKSFTVYWVNLFNGCSMSKLGGDLMAVSILVRYCTDIGSSPSCIFQRPDALDYLIDNKSTDKQIGLLLGKIQRIADTAVSLGENTFWMNLAPSSKFRSRLKRARKMFPETTAGIQTMLIPSKIYQGVLKKTIEDLECFLKYKGAIEKLFAARVLARDKGVRQDRKSSPSQLTKNQAARVTANWNTTVKKDRGIRDALDKLYEAGIIKSPYWAGLVDSLGSWQLKCGVLIAAFTGMRKGELLAIPFNGLNKLETEDGSIPVVWSSTTKLEANGSPRFTKWISCEAVELAFKVARIITEGALAWSDDRGVTDIPEQEIPLFFSVEHGKKGTPHPLFRFVTSAFSLRDAFARIYENELTITTQDLEEISWFLYGENIPNSIRENEKWPLTFHQFRRSMTVYAAASGKVSYPVLKAQLKHLSMIMTVYYSDSSSRAINILGDEQEVKALRAEWSEAKARVEADSLFCLLESDIPMAGIAGKKLRVQKSKGELPKFFGCRKSTKRAVKMGKVRYRPTLVGGCMSVSPCNKGAGVLASACISCENAVFLPGSRTALEQTKSFYEVQLAEGVPRRARQEYKNNIGKIESFLQNLVETMEID